MASLTLDLSYDEAMLLAVRLEYIVNEFKHYAAEERNRYEPSPRKIAAHNEHAAFFTRLAGSIRSQYGAGESVVLSDERALWPPCLAQE